MSFFYEGRADGEGYLMVDRYTKNKYFGFNPVPHMHNSLELLIVEHGEYDVYIDGETRRLRSGEGAFVHPTAAHTSGRATGTGDFSVYVTVASPAYFGAIAWLDGGTLPRFFNLGDSLDEVVSLLSLALSYGRNMENVGIEARQGFVLMLLGLLRKRLGVIPYAEGERRELLSRIVSYVGENYREEITLTGLAECLGYEKTYLSRVINDSLGMNLREYVNRLRIARVLALREENPHVSLSALSEECGYKSESTFRRAYKKYGAGI